MYCDMTMKNGMGALKSLILERRRRFQRQTWDIRSLGLASAEVPALIRMCGVTTELARFGDSTCGFWLLIVFGAVCASCVVSEVVLLAKDCRRIDVREKDLLNVRIWYEDDSIKGKN